MTIDEFLKEKPADGFLCTIESVPNDATKVKITPWIDEIKKCGCDSAIILDKDLIESLSTTDHVHNCCNQRHKVVEVIFKENASIKLMDYINLTIDKAKLKHSSIKKFSNNQDDYLCCYHLTTSGSYIYEWITYDECNAFAPNRQAADNSYCQH